MVEQYDRITLPNGVRIVTEPVSNVRSASVGIWVGTGSRDESNRFRGAAHFIEHMMFKGTSTRSAADLANIMDEIGGQVNAFTSKELTCYHGRVLDEHLPALLDVLCDMFFESSFDEADIANERGVILEEIDMYEDTPDDLAAERLFTAVYSGSPAGNALSASILGTPGTLSRLSGNTLKRYMASHYLGGNTVVAISGSFSVGDVEYLKSRFTAMPSGKLPIPPLAAYSPAFITRHKEIEQNHICVGFPGCSMLDERRYTFQLLNNVLGGGMSSRLFRRLREELGLCYSVYSFLSAQNDGGLLTIAVALAKENERAALAALNDELKRLLDDGVSPDELKRSREQIKSSILLGMESTSTRMTRLGRGELVFGRMHTIEETIAAYSAVTESQILELARTELSAEKLSASAVGQVRSKKTYESELKQ
jgi:predicted Zn-dependent peptidase